ncbi:serine hydrolase domain-containing protein [Pseudoalteromonas sp. NBT06-2]|uniref:serine hydrolase domain-containing protein n=1 Tax=Pseudoalteromonas sp. NBT06-2 TaxID=2025950 RepID=UPI00148237DE|nr:serine hydrolase domain-containing protein [Pseudoalteromonas sp. NBT06-2]
MVHKLACILFFISLSFITKANTSVNLSLIERELDANVPNMLTINNAPGVVVVLVDNKDIIKYKFYDFSNVEKQQTFNSNTGFNLGSISKLLTSWGVMRLVDKGLVELDIPVNDYLKRWKIPKSNFDTNKVTIRNILSHTSGLSLSGYDGWETPMVLPNIVDSLNGKTNGSGKVELITVPDKEFSYSGGGYTVLQLLIEDVTEQSFEEYMQKSVFTPLEMNSSTFVVSESVLKASATPYDEEGKATTMVYFTAQAAAGLQSTPHDIAKFTMAILKNGNGTYNGSKILHSDLIDEMIKPVNNTGDRWSMSYVNDIVNGNRLLGFAGFNHGWIGLTRSIVDKKFGYVVLTNSNIEAVRNQVDRLILKTALNIEVSR